MIRLINKSTTEKGPQMVPKLIRLREKLGQKAKREPHFRFYSLYGHLLRKDVLKAAWTLVRRNKGSPGIDNLSFEQIESSEGGVDRFLDEILEELRVKTYCPGPVKRVYIPKPNGSLRPLGIPRIKDRVCQMALLLIIEPIFEMDFHDCSYGFRPGRSAHQAIRKVQKAINKGFTAVYDIDLKGYFDSIPHDRLMKALEHRIADRHVLCLIRMWLKASIVDKNGTRIKPKKGTPQGGVISPLLANVYLHWFDHVFHRQDGPTVWARAKLYRYADDMVILAKFISKQLKDYIDASVEQWLGLEINQEKSQILDLRKGDDLTFLGYQFRQLCSSRTGRRYCHLAPSKKALSRAREEIKNLTSPRMGPLKTDQLIVRINRFLIGWGNYFKLGMPSKSYQKLNDYVGFRLFRHLKRRSQRGYKTEYGENWYSHFTRLGLRRLRKYDFSSNA